MSEKIRLAKLMSVRNICSRREAEKLIFSGQVLVNGSPWLDPAKKVNEFDDISILQEGALELDQKLTILLNKPLGYVSGQAEDENIPAVKLVIPKNKDLNFNSQIKFHKSLQLAPAGRLDIDSTGLLVLTESGVIAKQLIGENSLVEKEYRVKVEGSINEALLDRLRFGLSLDGKKLKKAKVEAPEDHVLQFTLTEGKKRQIRRMCEAVGLNIVSLKRVRIGKVKLGALKYGHWRFLEAHEEF